jgi:hypothetical protein
LLKILGGCGALLLVGVWLYVAGKRRAARVPHQPKIV